MPIGIDVFEGEESLGDPSTGERVVAHLAANDDKTFERSEIAAAIDADPNAVGSALTRLKDRGLVRHREHYWAVTDDHERLRDAYNVHALLEGLATGEDEPFDREAWVSEATPVEEYHTEDVDRADDG
jgi:Mn-dependent DtxR family transcriptional regulator